MSSTPGPAPRASVVVCTRNRSSALVADLEATLAQRPPFDWELLVVDNGSTDDTREVVEEIARRHPGRVRLAVEPTLGLSAARNLGLRLARGEWIAFLDDDATPAPEWLEAYDRAFFGRPGVAAAGGPVDPAYSAPPPDWLGPELTPYLSAWDRGGEKHRLSYPEFPRGANMAFRRQAFALVGGFDPRLGRRGRSLRSCEEIELCLRLDRIGAQVLYVPAARVRHRVDVGRLTPEWLAARFAAQGFSEAIVEWKHDGLGGLRRGSARQAEGRRAVEDARGAGSLLARCRESAARAHRLGSLYSLLFVPRWTPPASTDPAAG